MNKLLISLVLVGIFFMAANTAVIGIDFGSDFFQISLIMPGKSFVIVENATSKRQTNNAISFLGRDRVYESDAPNQRLKNPTNSFVFLNKFLGAMRDDKEVFSVSKRYYEEYMMKFTEPYGTVEFELDSSYAPFDQQGENEKITLRVEEVVGMILRYGQTLSEQFAGGGTIKDCVITVPNYYSLNQRRMLNQALKIAGLHAMTFVNENTAAAVNYGINLNDENKTVNNVIFFNVGSTGAQATLVEFLMTNQTSQVAPTKKIPSYNVLADYGIQNVGGQSLDYVIASHFADQIDAMPSRKGKPSIRNNRRSMVKLLKECIRIKETLSANKETLVFIEGLLEGSDFQSKIERTTLETKAADIFEQIKQPLEKVLQIANKTIEEIDFIELIGGGVRVPQIIEIVQKFAGKTTVVGQHLNGDETFAMGAAFIAANSSHGFRVRDIYLNDGYNFEVNLKVRNLDEVAQDHPDYYNKSLVLFPRKRRFGSKRIINFNYAKNIRLDLELRDDNGVVTPLAHYNLTNITNLTQHETNSNFTSPQIHVQFVLSPIDGVELEVVEAWVNETQIIQVQTKQAQKVPADDQKKNAKPNTNKTQEEDSSDSDDEEQEKAKEKEEGNDKKEQTASDSKKEGEQATNDDNDGEFSSQYTRGQKQRIIEKVAPQEPARQFKQQIIEHEYPINVEMWSSLLPYMSDEVLQNSTQKLKSFEEIEDKIRKLAEAKNKLESFIYQIKDVVIEDQFVNCSTEQEREQVKEAAEKTDEWLNSDEGATASIEDCKEKVRQLNDTAQPVIIRIDELNQRESAVNQTKQNLEDFKKKYGQLKQSMTWLTDAQKEPLDKLIVSTQEWFLNVTNLQASKPINEDPLFTSSELFHKLEDIKSEILQIKHIKQPKAEKNETATEPPKQGEEGELKDDEEENQQQQNQKQNKKDDNNDEEIEIPLYDENKVRTEDEDL